MNSDSCYKLYPIDLSEQMDLKKSWEDQQVRGHPGSAGKVSKLCVVQATVKTTIKQIVLLASLSEHHIFGF